MLALFPERRMRSPHLTPRAYPLFLYHVTHAHIAHTAADITTIQFILLTPYPPFQQRRFVYAVAHI